MTGSDEFVGVAQCAVGVDDSEGDAVKGYTLGAELMAMVWYDVSHSRAPFVRGVEVCRGVGQFGAYPM